MSTIFRRHHFTEDDDKYKEFYGGLHPLSRKDGQLIKELPIEERRKCMDLYKPPGIIEEVTSELGKIGFRSNFKQMNDKQPTEQNFKDIFNTVPSNIIFLSDQFDGKQDQQMD